MTGKITGNTVNSDVKVLHKLVIPSSLSSAFIIILCIVIFVPTILLTRFYNVVPQGLQGLDFIYQHSHLIPTAHDISDKIADNRYLQDSPLFVFWCLVGLVCYSVVEYLLKVLQGAEEVAEEFSYVNIKREGVLSNIVLRTIVRIVAVILTFLLFRFTLFKLLPVCISSIQTVTINPSVFSDWISALFGIVFFAICLHAIVVLVRLVFLRPRIFGEELIF